MSDIKFGTDGWRAIIAKDYTVANVTRVSEATAKWLLAQKSDPVIVLGHDCRFGGEMFAEVVAKVMGSMGVKTIMAKGFVSTPMVSLGAVELKTDLGVVLTASHNPPSYNGFKLKGSFGGPLLPAEVSEVEDLIQPAPSVDLDSVSIKDLEDKGLIEYCDLEQMYIDRVVDNFDLDVIKKSGMKLAYDAMYGAGQNVLRRILPDTVELHCEYNPSFMGQAPEPIHKNLLEFSEMIKTRGDIDLGLATDGDADRIGLYDSEGNFVDSHHIILLLIHYLFHYKKMTGKVCTAFSTTPKVVELCKHYGLDCEVVKIGFKYICGIMIKEDVLIGGEESGGIAVKGHIPERDGIWIGLVLLEFMAKTGKKLPDLIKEVYDIVGEFSFERSDLHIREDLKQDIIANCKAGNYDSFGPYKVSRIEDIDGWKYFFDNGEWLMIRPSGTEPVLRTYAESNSRENAFKILKAGEETLLN